jgi:predicted DNA-binding protein
MSLMDLDPNIAKAAQSIQGMPPPQAIQYLAQRGVPMSTAIAIMQNIALKQHAGAAPQGGPPPTATIKDQLAQAVQQKAAEPARQGGVAAMPVSPGMFEKGMAAGGIVAFAGGGTSDPSLFNDNRPDGSPPDFPGIQFPVVKDRVPQQYQVGSVTGAGLDSVHAGLGALADKLGYFWSGKGNPGQPAAQGSPAVKPTQSANPYADYYLAKTLGMDKPASQPAPAGANAGADVDISMSTRGPNTGEFGRIEQKMQQQVDAQNADVAEVKKQALSPQDNLNRLSAMSEQQGIGAAAKQHLADLEDRKAQLQAVKKQGGWLALSQAGFAMAQAATNNPHGGFLGALAVGGTEGAKDFTQRLKEYREANNQINDQMYAVAQAQENIKSGNVKTAVELSEKQENRLDTLASRAYSTQDSMLRTVYGKEIQSMATAGRIKEAAMMRGAYNIDAASYFSMLKSVNPTTGQLYTPLEALHSVRAESSSVQSSQINSDQRRQAVREKMTELDPNYGKLAKAYAATIDPQKKQAIASQIMAMEDVYSGNIYNQWGQLTKVDSKP